MSRTARQEFHQAIDVHDKTIVKYLLNLHGHRPDFVNSENGAGYTALHKSCLNANIDFVRRLVELGADVEKVTLNEKWTALHCACLNGDTSVVGFLLDSLSNPYVKDIKGRFPVDLIQERQTKDILEHHMRSGSKQYKIVDYSRARHVTHRRNTWDVELVKLHDQDGQRERARSGGYYTEF